MIKIVAKALIKDDKVNEFVEGAKALAAASRKENGNISYTINVNVQNPRQFAFIEMWEDQAALDEHMKTNHFLSAMAALKDQADGEMNIEVYTEV